MLARASPGITTANAVFAAGPTRGVERLTAVEFHSDDTATSDSSFISRALPLISATRTPKRAFSIFGLSPKPSSIHAFSNNYSPLILIVYLGVCTSF